MASHIPSGNKRFGQATSRVLGRQFSFAHYVVVVLEGPVVEPGIQDVLCALRRIQWSCSSRAVSTSAFNAVGVSSPFAPQLRSQLRLLLVMPSRNTTDDTTGTRLDCKHPWEFRILPVSSGSASSTNSFMPVTKSPV